MTDSAPPGTVAVLALGEHEYGLVRPFWGGEEGPNRPHGVTSVAVTPDGTVLILRRADPPILAVAPDGTTLRTLAEGVIEDGHSLTVGHDGLLWVVDRDAHEVVGLSLDGTIERRLGRRHHPVQGGAFNHPAAVATTADGHVYVADGYGNHLVHVFDADGRMVHRFGGRGAGEGRFATPHGILLTRDDRVLVADRENDRVQVFDLDGLWVTEWRDLHRPMDLAETPEGDVLVSDQVPRLSRFVGDEYVGGARPVASAGHGLCVAGDGSIYLAETPPRDRVIRMVPLMGRR